MVLQKDTRPTTPFGFAVGNNVAFGGGPCKCSNADTFTLARTTTATTVKVVIADIGDRSFNSWIFMGFTGFADEVDITQTVTSTISVPVTSTVTATTSTETDVVTFSQTNTLTTTTTLLPATVTTTAATSTTTVVNPICTNYILQCERSLYLYIYICICMQYSTIIGKRLTSKLLILPISRGCMLSKISLSQGTKEVGCSTTSFYYHYLDSVNNYNFRD